MTVADEQGEQAGARGACSDLPTPGAPSPLEVLERAMWRKWAEGDWDGAVAIARIAIPYRHARLNGAPPDRVVADDLRLVDDDELQARLVEARERVSDQAEPANESSGMGNRGSDRNGSGSGAPSQAFDPGT
jgi:hypothetical protein